MGYGAVVVDVEGDLLPVRQNVRNFNVDLRQIQGNPPLTSAAPFAQ